MNSKKLMIILAILMMASVPICMAAEASESDAYISYNGDPYVSSEFKNNGSGTIAIPLTSTETKDIPIELTATYKDSGKIAGTTTITVPAATSDNPTVKVTAYISFSIGSTGSYNIIISCNNPIFTGGDTNILINVSESIWTNWTTYLAIIIVVILIVIAVVYKMRTNPNMKPQTTFRQLEQYKNTGTMTEEQPKNTHSSSTEKKRYAAPSEKKTEEKPKTMETPAKKPAKQSFSDLEKEQKKEKPAKEEKKKASSNEPQKAKYISSRRK